MKALIRFYWLLAPALPACAGLSEAIAYLEEEVPRWRRENKCHSCHNNGDGARALWTAAAAGKRVDPAALADSLAGLLRPAEWEPKPLAFVQYAAALRAASQSGAIADAAAETRVAEILVKAQADEGHWKVDEEKVAGAPATYGPEIATALAAAVVERAGMTASASKARRWLDTRRPAGIVGAAGVLMAGVRNQDAALLLVSKQAANGSWIGEPFDTAIAILGLARLGGRGAEIRRGREWLLRNQLSGGGWAATTRPSGGDSYAQHISTTSWAVLALLASEGPERARE